MAKALIITEKPSVARDIVAALGGFTAQAGTAYWESERYLVSFAVGHVLELLSPEDIDPVYRSWKLALLPILPKSFQLKPVSGHERRLELLGRLIARPDVETLINACDAAREGELIFREVLTYTGSRKRVRRLWLQSMTAEAIRAGFLALRDGSAVEGLGQAAECRARSDWLIGMNATRAFSERLRARGERLPWSVGRVQTPTLALLVERELQVLSHRPQPYWRCLASFAAPATPTHAAHRYEGTWFDPKFRATEAAPERKDDRLFKLDDAQRLLAATAPGQPAVASETREESLRHAPPLFSLTGLQKAMASRFKWSSKRTLEAAQRCYETHKVLTYPRTSSSCLPADYRGEVDRLIAGLVGHSDYGAAAAYLVEHGRRNEGRTFNDAGVSDHFAIIPTGKRAGLAGDDARLYDAVVRRLLATFHPPAVYNRVKRLTVVGGRDHFRTGPVETLMVPGWLAVYDKQPTLPDQRPDAKPDKTLPPLAAPAGVGAVLVSARLAEEQTKPPPRISEAGLLGLMEHAGRQVEDEELAAALMHAAGLGTAATRADIIQNLKAKGYIDDELQPTVKGIHLIRTLRRLSVARLTSPELTARLELELAEVERGERSAATFMGEVSRYVTDVVEAARRCDWRQVYADIEPLGGCPVCGRRQVFERVLTYDCAGFDAAGAEACAFRLAKDTGGRYLDRVTAAELVRTGRTGLLDGFRARSGRAFKASLVLDNGELRLCGDEVPPAEERPAGPAVATARSGGWAPAAAAGPRAGLALCPVHTDGSCRVVETRAAYVCERRLAAFAAGDREPVGFMAPKILCGRALSAAEVTALITDGVTPVLDGLMSKAGKPFSARLRRTEGGGFVFEFPERLGASAAPAQSRSPGRGGAPAVASPAGASPAGLDATDAKGRDHAYPRRRAGRRPPPRKPDERSPP